MTRADDSIFVPLPAGHGGSGHGRTVLVTGATGNQGGATARHLLGAGWQVRALVRDPGSPAARALAQAGAQLIVGDMTDRGSLDRAAAGVYGVFSVQGLPGYDADSAAQAEVDMGVNVAEAALSAGACHLVYTSVAGADRDPEPWHWRTKARIEDHIRTLNLPYTFLRPVMFMENHASRSPYGITGDAALIRVIPPAAHVQMIAASDIGAFAALAFADPERYAGLSLELAGDEVTGDQLAEAISRAIGRPVNREPLAPEILEGFSVDAARLDAMTQFGGWQADLLQLRVLHPGLLDFEGWLAAGGASRLSALFAAV
jgi:uncharacterized protein YbjT (DUF2867 family)